MNSVKESKKHQTRRGFVKELAVGGTLAATASCLSGWMANASPILQAISQQTSDGKTKYGKCVVPIPFRDPKQANGFSAGADILNGFPCTIIYNFAYKAGLTGRSTEPHVHDYDEAIYFIGSDPENIADLGAEVEFLIGPKGEEEKHVFSVPTVIVVPKGLYHTPMYTKSIQKPYLCMAVSLTGNR